MSLQLLQRTKPSSENSATAVSGLPQLRNPDAQVASVPSEVKTHLSNKQVTSNKWKSNVGSKYHLSQQNNKMDYPVRLCLLPGWGCPQSGYSHKAPGHPLSSLVNSDKPSLAVSLSPYLHSFIQPEPAETCRDLWSTGEVPAETSVNTLT